MGTDIPKQFLLLNGKPVLMHTLDKFIGVCDELILVLPEAQVAYWKELCAQHQFTTIHKIVNGGSERFYSVLNGLSSINSDEGLVAIHDGVRPCVSVQLIQRTFEEAALHGAAIAAVKSKDSLRKVTSTGTEAVDRSHFYLVQTPQTFSLAKLKEAYRQPYQSFYTDDASVFEANGAAITLVEGDYKNIKITTPEDLPLAELYV
jgi:2-C-methyl-D-erythritol 4-phosphate cytidylyltransferase